MAVYLAKTQRSYSSLSEGSKEVVMVGSARMTIGRVMPEALATVERYVILWLGSEAKAKSKDRSVDCEDAGDVSERFYQTGVSVRG